MFVAIGFIGWLFLYASLISFLLQAVVVLIQSIRYDHFWFVGGWDWLGWTLTGFIAGIILILLALVLGTRALK